MWHDGRAHGYGRLKLPTGEEYLGLFRHGMADGQGREFDVTGEMFEGDFHAGRRHGHGKTKLASGSSYDSSWVNGVETPGSERIRVAQFGGPSSLGGDVGIRMGITVVEKPSLPAGIGISDIVPYASSNDGNTITVQPVDRQLMSVWKGNGQLQTQPQSYTTRTGGGLFQIDGRYIDSLPPTFTLSFENHSAQPITIESLRLQVSESNTDNQPAIQMMEKECHSTFSVDFNLENFGWSPANGAQMNMSFSAPGGPPARQITKPIGRIADRVRVDFEQQLQQFNVNVAQLKRMQRSGINCPSGSLPACLAAQRSNPLFGTLGRQLGLDGLQIFVPAAGTLDYTWVDSKGLSHNRSSPFQVKLLLALFSPDAECGEGGAPEPSKINAVQLRLDAANYTIPLQFQHTIPAGQMARVGLPVAAAKSSDHSFRIIANLANGQEVTSLPIRLLYFRPRHLPTP
jgi:hypothetical protein